MYILLLILLLFYTFLLLPWQVNCKIMVKTVTLCWYHQVRCHFQQLLSQLGFFQEKKYAMLEKNLEKTNWNWGWLISGLIDGAQWAFHENWLWYQKFPRFRIPEPHSTCIFQFVGLILLFTFQYEMPCS